jgi:hypothetical protein
MNKNKKWYNNKELVTMLLMLIPPLGIYGVYNSETIPSRWKNILYIALGLTILFFLYLYFI